MTDKNGTKLAQFLNLLALAEVGEKISKDDWDLEKVVLPVKDLVKRYRITWEKDQVVNTDLDLADRVFAAARELLNGSGVYAVENGRIIPVSEKMVDDGLGAAPRALVMGEGLEKVELKPRAVVDPTPPTIWGGSPGVPTPESLFYPMALAWAQEPLVDLATCGSISPSEGSLGPQGAIGEILATRQELTLFRRALVEVNRPGMGMLAAQSSVGAWGDLAAANPDLLRPCDAHLLPMLNELMIDGVSLTRVANSLGYGMRNASLATVMVGGLGGGPAGAAVLQAAALMAANLVCLADYHLLHPIHLRYVATSTREVLWVQSVVSQAFARNAPCIMFADVYPKSGAGTDLVLYETAANALVATVSGAHLEGVGAADGMLPNCSGLEVRLMAEVGRSAAARGIDLAGANALALKLLALYEPVFSREGGYPGQRFDQVYDVESAQPTEGWRQVYGDVREKLQRMGVV